MRTESVDGIYWPKKSLFPGQSNFQTAMATVVYDCQEHMGERAKGWSFYQS